MSDAACRSCGGFIGTCACAQAQTQAEWLTNEVAIMLVEGWPDTCVLWPFSASVWNYGQVRCTAYGRTVEKVHRLVWRLAYGTWPVHTLDHVKPRCASTLCFNITHLEDVTSAENSRREALNGRCARQHELSGANLYVNGLGHRVCRQCRNSANRRFRAKRKGSS